MANYYDGWTWTLGPGDELQGAIANPAVANTYIMKYCLWDNSADFESYTTYAENGANTPTTQMTTNLLAYQSYSLQIVCDVTSAVTANGAGCCLMDVSGQNGGGYCMVYTEASGSTPAYFATYYLTNANFLTSISTSTLANTFAVKDPKVSADVLLGFEYFDCTITATKIGVCSHF